MTATEELRRLLDERGVEYRFNEITKVFEWHFEGTDGDGSAHATEVHGGINIIACSLTPAQAIAATLNSFNCTNDCTNGERTGTCHDIGDRGDFRCSACLVEWQGAENHDFRYCPSCGAKVIDE